MAQRIEDIIKHTFQGQNLASEKHEYFLDARNDFYTVNDDLYDTMNSAYDEIRFPNEALKHEAQQLKHQHPRAKQPLLEAKAYENLLDSLGYWTIYYHPAIEDNETAVKCDLTPFYHQNKHYLALGDCGLDLTPRLDAYQMLTARNVPADSDALHNPEYFTRVLGENLAAEALAACKRPTPRIYLSYDAQRQAVKEPSLEEQLAQFNGTEDYYRSSFGTLLLTDGAQYLREKAGASWLMDLIESYQPKLRNEEFQLWGIKVEDDHSATVYCKADSDQPNLLEQKIEYTDFPMKEYELFCVNNIVLLKNEY
jgi:hypothetical protein